LPTTITNALTVCFWAKTQVRFVIMGNLFCSEYPIHRRFDLKGSSLGRTTDKPHTEIDQYTTLKDLDLNFIFRLNKQWFQEFQRWSYFISYFTYRVLLVLLEIMAFFVHHVNKDVKYVEAGK